MTLMHVLILFVIPLNAQDDLDFADMSLEDLLNVEVTTASKSAESQWDAPGVVTVISAQEIERFGANDLWELLERVPGFQPLWNSFSGKNMIPVRGDLPTIDDNHILVLYDGRPVTRNSWDGGGHSPLYSLIPLDMIDHIEIVRGPGSVLYGTNAFQGVVNIIPKKGEQAREVRLSLGGGSNGYTNGNLFWGFEKNGFDLSAGLKVADKDGYDFRSATLDGGTFDTQNFAEDHIGLFTTMSYKGFKLSYMLLEKNDFQWFSQVAGSEGSIDQSFNVFNLSYTRQISDNWSFELHAGALLRDYDFIFFGGLVWDIPSDDYIYEATLFGKIGDKFNVVLGGNLNDMQGESKFAGLEWDFEWKGAYVQLDYRFNEKVKLIGGGQLNKPHTSSSRFSPRFGGIFNFNERSGVKVLGGEAFRSPVADELLLEAIAGLSELSADPNTKPELVFTTDVQFFYEAGKYQLALTYYKNEQEDLIGIFVDPNDAERLIISNKPGTREITGFEFESKFVPNANWLILASATTQENEQEGVDDTTLAPDLTFKLGVSYTNKWFNIGVYDSYFDEYKDNAILNPGRLNLNPPNEASHLVSAKVSVNFSNIIGKKFEFSVYGTNLLDETQYIPDINEQGINTLPGRSDTAITAKAKVVF